MLKFRSATCIVVQVFTYSSVLDDDGNIILLREHEGGTDIIRVPDIHLGDFSQSTTITASNTN
jgi:hypothetical protein